MKKVNDNNKEHYGSFYSTMYETIFYTHIVVLEGLYIDEELLFVDSKNRPLKTKELYIVDYKFYNIKLPKNYLKRIKKTIKRIYETIKARFF